ncbi:MAG: SBBP repeat-containing protein, partial [Thermodesulfobacteriota bacterium]
MTKINAAGDTVIFSTYLGGLSNDRLPDIALDIKGRAYVTGQTDSTDFPTVSAYDGVLNDGVDTASNDVFVTRFNIAGSALSYSTYLGGTAAESYPDIAVDSSNNAYLTGYTGSTDFPTASAYQGSNAGSYDAFVTKIDKTGSTLTYSTYLGGGSSDYAYDIAVDSSGAAYVTGETSSNGFPTVSAIYGDNTNTDVFVTKLDPEGSAIAYSTYLGGTGYDLGQAIAVDGAGAAYVMGYTDSGNFPTASAIYGTYAGGTYDAFVSKIGPQLLIDASSLSFGIKDIDYASYALTSGGDGSYTFSVSVGSLPAGLNLNTLTGLIDGTPTAIGDTAFTLQVVDGNGDIDTQAYTLTVYDSAALDYSTFLGGTGSDYGYAIAVDSTGAAYLTGATFSTDFPTESPIYGDDTGLDAFVTKIDAAGSSIVYSTYLGGVGNDYGSGIAVDSRNRAYVTGDTTSTDFPTVSPLYGSNSGGRDAFVTKLYASGSTIDFSTYLGGTGDDYGYDIALNAWGDAYVTGKTYSSDYPTIKAIDNSLGGSMDAFVTKIDAAGFVVVYSTYLGGGAGGGSDTGEGIAVDSSGAAYVAGWTSSTDFPTESPIYSSLGGPIDAIVTKLNAAGTAFIYSTYLGGTGSDYAYDIAVDSSGSAYVTGFTNGSFPTISAIYGTGVSAAFVTKVNAAGSALTYSTYLGGSSADTGRSIAVDASGSVYVTGYTYSTNFPTASPIFGSHGGGTFDAFVTKIDAAGSALTYSTYLGGVDFDLGNGIAVDSSGAAYVIGETKSADFPTSSAMDGSLGGTYDAFVSKIVGNYAPVLSYSSESGYASTDGVDPESGVTTTSFTYKVVYTDVENDAPSSKDVIIDGGAAVDMSLDTGAAASLHDGDYTNGEQYKYTTTHTVATHDYYFSASDGGSTVTLPSSGSVSAPEVAAVPSFSYPSLSGGYLTGATTGSAYSETASGSGGIAPLAWSISSGSLPTGLDINSSTGEIWGTPTVVGDYSFTVAYTDNNGDSASTPMAILVTCGAGVTGVDLVVSSLSAPKTVQTGGIISVSATAYNQGIVDAGRFYTYFFMSTDALISSDDKLMGYHPTWGGLTKCSNQNFSVSLTIPITLGTGTHYIIAVTDYTDEVTESNESNNTKTTALYPDLVVTSLTGPSVGTAGAAISVSSTVKNQGVMATGDVHTNYYLSIDSIITPSDYYIGSTPTWGSMDTGTTNSSTTSHMIPGNVPAGIYYIGAIVDPGNANDESSEGNNTRASSGTISISAGMDLVVTALSGPSSRNAGSTMSLTSTVKNQGTGASGDVHVYFYLSVDTTITTDDIYIGYRPIWGSMAPGTTNTATSTQHTIPVGTA